MGVVLVGFEEKASWAVDEEGNIVHYLCKNDRS
jgi:hypothetical protein